jgi:hypothetical protein
MMTLGGRSLLVLWSRVRKTLAVAALLSAALVAPVALPIRILIARSRGKPIVAEHIVEPRRTQGLPSAS